MPGILKRTHDLVDPQNDAGEFHDGERPSKRQATGISNGEIVSNGHGLVNGEGSHNDASQSADAIAATVQELQKSVAPPELFHIEDGFIPLASLGSRMAQEAHNALEELIAELARFEDDSAHKERLQAKMDREAADPKAEKISIPTKKELLWDFAQSWRTKFIKLMAISQWSRNAEAVSKIIDINFFIMQQKASYKEAVNWMGELKRVLVPEKLPAPDLRAAIEIMSTGKVPWIPNMGYIPPEPLTPKEMLAGMRTLNSLLTIRLITQEAVPPQLADWSVKSGRVTFFVEDEFELDLSIADEDPSSQFYFIDLRFAFSPGSRTIAEGQLRNHLERKANDILREKGLLGCYEFLHELILEHKLTILRNQVRQMVRERWSGDAILWKSVRGVVVQYWATRPGRKNWVEIGINSGRRGESEYSNGHASSYIAVRWHRHGVEVKDHELEIDPANLSMDRFLREVIARHTNYIFKETKRRMKANKIRSETTLFVKHRAHAFDPQECSLTVQLSRKKTVKIEQDCISGKFMFSPQDPRIATCETRMNSLSDPAGDSAEALEILRCNHALQSLKVMVKTWGWKDNTLLYSPSPSTLRSLFKTERLRFNFFSLGSWPSEYILAVTTSSQGDKLWVIETQDVPKDLTAMDWATGTYQPLKRSFEIQHTDKAVVALEPQLKDMESIEHHGLLLIAQLNDCRNLARRNATYEQVAPKRSSPVQELPELYVKYPIPGESQKEGDDNSWCCDIIKIAYPSVSKARKEICTTVVGRLRKHHQDMQALAGKMDNSLAFNPDNGNFAFNVWTSIGESSIGAIREKLYRFAALVKFLNTAGRYSLSCSQLSLNSMTFEYSIIPPSEALSVPNGPELTGQLTATIKIPSEGKMRISFGRENPHLYIADFLTEELSGPDGLDSVAATMLTTLPILNTVSEIDAKHALRDIPPSFYVLPRSSTCFILRYSNKSVALEVEARLRLRQKTVLWLTLNKVGYIGSEVSNSTTTDNSKVLASKPSKSSDTKSKDKSPSKPTNASSSNKADPKSTTKVSSEKLLGAHLTLDSLRKAWTSLTRERGEGWHGIGSGILVELSAAIPCLKRIDSALSDLFSNAPDDPLSEIPSIQASAPESKETKKSAALEEKTKPSPKLTNKNADTNANKKPPQPQRPQPSQPNSQPPKQAPPVQQPNAKPSAPPPSQPKGPPVANMGIRPPLQAANSKASPPQPQIRQGGAAVANMQPSRPSAGVTSGGGPVAKMQAHNNRSQPGPVAGQKRTADMVGTVPGGQGFNGVQMVGQQKKVRRNGQGSGGGGPSGQGGPGSGGGGAGGGQGGMQGKEVITLD